MFRIIINILLLLFFNNMALAEVDEYKDDYKHFIGDVSTAGKANGHGMESWIKNPGKGDKFYGQFKNGARV